MPDRSGPAKMQFEINTPGLWRRFAYWLYEGMLLFAVAVVATWLFSTLGQMRSGIDTRRPLLITFLLVVFGIYFAWFWAKGQTLAMKTWKLRVVDHHGNSLTQSRAIFRYVMICLWLTPPLAAKDLFGLTLAQVAASMLGWIAAWGLLSRLRTDRQFWHDVWAGTRLINARPINR